MSRPKISQREALRALAERLLDKTRLRKRHGLTGWVLAEEALASEAAATLLAIAEKMEEDKHTVQKIRGRKIP